MKQWSLPQLMEITWKYTLPLAKLALDSISQFMAFQDPSPLFKHITYLTTFLSTILSLRTAKATTGTTLQNTSGFHLWTPLTFRVSSHMVKLLLCRLPAPCTCSHYKSFTFPSATSTGICPAFLTFPFCTELWLFRLWPQKSKPELLLHSKASNV